MMNKNGALRIAILFAAASALFLVSPAWAETYPVKPAKVVVAFPPGGNSDILGRMVATELSLAFKQPFVVENRAGASGIVGTGSVAKADPDGYTLLLGASGALASSLSLFPDIRYDVPRDFACVGLVADNPIVLAARPNLKANSVAELIALAKAQPKTLNVGLPSVGALQHLLGELFQIRTGTKFTNIPYKGSSPAIVDLAAEQVDLDFDNLSAILPFIQSKQVKPLAIASKERSPVLPDVPTMAEVGYPDLTASPWFALVAPKATPPEIIQSLNEKLVRIMKAPEVQDRLAKQGANALWSTPQECDAFIASEIARWAKVIREAGVRAQ